MPSNADALKKLNLNELFAHLDSSRANEAGNANQQLILKGMYNCTILERAQSAAKHGKTLK